MIQPERIEQLNEADAGGGRYVLYWVQASQREQCNHALEYALEQADELGLPAVACFGLTGEYPEANLRHYRFLLEGLAELSSDLALRGVQLVVRRGDPPQIARELAGEAAMVVCDRGYLRHQRQWRDELAVAAPCRVVQVESDAVVPVDLASEKEEYAARTIRPKIHRQLERFLVPLKRREVKRDSLGMDFDGLDVRDVDGVLDSVEVDRSVPPVDTFQGGASRARELLTTFIDTKLSRYAADRNDPSQDIQSHMSPYLHFGQISPLQVALRVAESGAGREAIDAYLEELIVRRELSINYVYYNRRYDAYAGLPDWARKTLRIHKDDAREHSYTRNELEAGETHDACWNAAQRELVLAGKMHNYMRMYWGKKILQWRSDPADAFRIALWLNDKYELDGRDPNSYTGVAWCFGKHDRPWQEREIFGKVRYMSAGGLERKFDMAGYIAKVAAL
ncbi:MAG: deoxyribodipyrimidine photo-lyase [Planctomycetota bacterium]